MGHNEAQVIGSIHLTMTPELATELQRETGALEVAHAYVVDSPAMAQEANKELKAVKIRILRMKELKAGFVAPAKTIIANAEALFDPPIKALTDAEQFIKIQLTVFQQLEERRIEDARRAREVGERLARQKAEQEAAAARARAEEEAREQRRRATEAEEARRKAEAEGNAKAAAKAAAEAAAAASRANAVEENAERKAQAIELAASALPSKVVEPEPVKLDGFSTRDNWVAELGDGFDDEAVKREICSAIGAGRLELLSLVKLDMPAANKLAKALKKNFHVPGLVSVNRPIAASRA